MEFVQVKVSIDVDFGTMTKDQYKEFLKEFEEDFLNRKQISNQKIMDALDLDKRPFFVSRIEEPRADEPEDAIEHATIEFVC